MYTFLVVLSCMCLVREAADRKRVKLGQSRFETIAEELEQQQQENQQAHGDNHRSEKAATFFRSESLHRTSWSYDARLSIP
eukprot:6749519-Prorocentrum_lima.AAC.1